MCKKERETPEARTTLAKVTAPPSRSRAGSPLLDAIDVGARRSARFRRALRGAYMGDEVPAAAKSRLERFLESPKSSPSNRPVR
ncbi:MAG: hypothetical protein LC808_38270 [Actinobacteria bacterium]|nr:hypothetical protein [Actinomycetota bacterium]